MTIWLENGKIEPFIERMNELGITGAKQGDYEARFTFYDQGYSRIQPSLEALSGTAELLLILSSSLLVIAALLLAFFYAQSQKQSIGTMRLLGCSKARAFAAVMLSALIIAVTGALIGAAIGHALTASVGESIMANANQTPEEFLAFSAYLAESTQVEVEFALGADAKVSLLTCLAALGLFIAGTLVFVHALSRQRTERAAATGGRVKDYMPKRLPRFCTGASLLNQIRLPISLYFSFFPVTLFSIATKAHMVSITAKMPIMPLSVSSREGISVSGDQANFIALSINMACILLFIKAWLL